MQMVTPHTPQFNMHEVCSTNLIRTGRLTRPLPIINENVESPATLSPLNPLILNSGILEQSRQYSRVPEGREYPTIVSTSEHITIMEGQFLPPLAQGVSLPIFDEYASYYTENENRVHLPSYP